MHLALVVQMHREYHASTIPCDRREEQTYEKQSTPIDGGHFIGDNPDAGCLWAEGGSCTGAIGCLNASGTGPDYTGATSCTWAVPQACSNAERGKTQVWRHNQRSPVHTS